jgi:hypothetical protein
MQGGEYRKIIDVSTDLICTKGYNETFRTYFEEFQAAQDIKVPWKSCPYPTGSYKLSNFLIQDYGDVLPPYMPGSERWQFQIRYSKEEVEYGGFNAYITLRTEQSLLNG